MSRQARHRRRSRGGSARVLIICGGVLAFSLVVGAIGAIGYVLNVAQSAPALSTLHPILGGGTSQVYASDGTRLGAIQSDELPQPGRLE